MCPTNGLVRKIHCAWKFPPEVWNMYIFPGSVTISKDRPYQELLVISIISIHPPSNPSHVAFIFVRFNHVIFVDAGCSIPSQQFETSNFGTCQSKSSQNGLKVSHQLTPRLLRKGISWGNVFATTEGAQSDKCKFQTTLCASFDPRYIDSDLDGLDQNCKQMIVAVQERAVKQKGIGVIATFNNHVLICVVTIRRQLYTHSWWTNGTNVSPMPMKQRVELEIVIVREGHPIGCSVEHTQRNCSCIHCNRLPLPVHDHDAITILEFCSHLTWVVDWLMIG